MGQQVGAALTESMHRVMVKLVSFLPALLALLVALVVLTAIGAVLAVVIRRILVSARFDERFGVSQNATVADIAPAHSPTLLISRVAFWACIVLGLIIGISAFDAAYPGDTQITSFVIPYLTHSVGAVIILLIGTVLARFLSRSVLIGAVNLQMQYARFLSLGIKWLVLVLTAAMILDHLEIGGSIVALAFGILFGGIVLTLSLAIGLGSRDLVSRSLEKNVDAVKDAEFESMPPPATRPAETLRHF
jgi:hypothetical protein